MSFPPRFLFLMPGTALRCHKNNHAMNGKRLLLPNSPIKSPLFHQGNAVDVR
ncbi:hypothetical protein BN137_1050 [Cronobacter condimenti 1330]|uniref:Uncharacterized protein n=1 Tax=Cronobacter condimenti 1330 TaxID=1073999 RepID=K7ZZI8_9ENTR|nr:hypothetical protein BN137_1050 [Cronobacter condimenti 1330]